MANKLPITGMPKMKMAIRGWTRPIILQRIDQSIIKGDTFINKTNISFTGTFQPLKTEEVQLKSEGQRSWDWFDIHSFSGDLNLKNNDRIEIDDVEYKVMGKKDYSLNGYIEYHIIRDYQS